MRSDGPERKSIGFGCGGAEGISSDEYARVIYNNRVIDIPNCSSEAAKQAVANYKADPERADSAMLGQGVFGDVLWVLASGIRAILTRKKRKK